MRNTIPIPKKTLLDWLECLGYVFHDIDIDYESPEARGQVEALYEELKILAKHNGIDYIAELRKRGALADSPKCPHCKGTGVEFAYPDETPDGSGELTCECAK